MEIRNCWIRLPGSNRIGHELHLPPIAALV
jgi:hypothetical protein